MVRGRRARTVTDSASAVAAANTLTRMANGTAHLVDDQYCASPKRKDCRIDDVATNLKAAIQSMNGYHHATRNKSTKGSASGGHSAGGVVSKEISNFQIFGAKTRSQTAIRQYFRETKTQSTQNDGENADDDDDDDGGTEFYANGNTIGAELEVQTTSATNSSSIDISEDTCDGLPDCVISCKTNQITNTSDNIFLQAPVLSLNVDKSPNQASSIKINKTLEVDPIFPNSNGYHQLNGQFNKIVSLRSASLESTTQILLNTDSNSCDSGVVVDKQTSIAVEMSPSRRRKPTTPHRILCPSPVKHAIVEKSPASALSKRANGYHPHHGHHGYVPAVNGHANGLQKRNPKSRRRLNANQSENHSSMTSPQLVGGVTLKNHALTNENGSSDCSQKSLFSSTKTPTAEQNTEYSNYKATQNKVRNNGQMQPRERNLQIHNGNANRTTQQQQVVPVDTNKKVTDFFPVRRSVRKTKKAVQEEMMRSIEKAIIDGREDGLRVEHFEGKGRGVIAERLFKRGEFVIEYIGELITISEANDRETKYSLDENAGCYMYYFKHRNQQYCIDATAETGKLGRLVNHSRNGNLITKVVVIKNHPHLVLIAKDDIQPGEEITYDYGDRSKESLLHHPWLAL